MSRRDTEGTEVDLHGYSDNIPSEEEEGHLQNDETTNPNGLRIRYFYPRLRYSTLFRGLVLVDALVTVVLWLTGGDSNYFINNIKNFKFSLSVFDLAVLSVVKIPFYLFMVRHAEKIAIRFLDAAYNHSLRSRFLSNIAMICSISFIAFVFTVVKGSLILEKILSESATYPGMHKTYYACVIWSASSSFIIFLLSVSAKCGFKTLQAQRVKKFYNSEGQEVDKDGKPVQKKVNLYRLACLAKPEAGLITVGMVALLMTTAVQTVAPLFFGKVVDAALDSMESLNRTVLILLVIYLVGSVFSLVRAWIFTLAGQRLVARLRSQLFGSVVIQEIAFFDVNRTGELCNRLSSDTTVLQNAVTVNLSMLCRYLLQIIGSLALMFYLNASLTGVLLAIVPVVTLSAMQYGLQKHRQFTETSNPSDHGLYITPLDNLEDHSRSSEIENTNLQCYHYLNDTDPAPMGSHGHHYSQVGLPDHQRLTGDPPMSSRIVEPVVTQHVQELNDGYITPLDVDTQTTGTTNQSSQQLDGYAIIIDHYSTID